MKTMIAAFSALVLSAGAACAASTTPTPLNNAQNTPADQTNDTTSAQPNDQATMQSSAKLTEQLRDNLSSAGFTDIKIMPESFLIRAKDKNGNPMIMVLNPDSMTEIRAVDTNKAKGSSNNSTNPSAGPDQNTQK